MAAEPGGHRYNKARCSNTYKEFVNYEYARTKDGEFISAYSDKNNHAIDAVRYGYENLMLAFTAAQCYMDIDGKRIV